MNSKNSGVRRQKPEEITSRKQDVHAYLNLDQDFELMSVVTLGYSDEGVSEGCRKTLKNLLIEP